MSSTATVYCRLCAECFPVSETFDLSSNTEVRTDVIDKLAIFSVNAVDFTDKTLPETVCAICRDSLSASYKFFHKIEQAQALLKEVKSVPYPSYKELTFGSKDVKIETLPNEQFMQCSIDKTDYDDVNTHEDDAFNSYETGEIHTPQPDEDLTIEELKVEQSYSEDHRYQHSNSEDNQFQCTTCGKSFPSWKELQQHTSTDNDHTPRKRTKATIDDLTCNICYKVFSVPAKLKYHKVIHTDRRRDFVCDVCGKAFYSKESLNLHTMIHNPERQDCKICKKTFINLIRLRKHLKTHETVKPFECNECHRRFRLKNQLGRHMVVHSNVFPFSCEYCKKGFRFKNVLKTHENIHTGAKPFVCSVCGMDFTNWSNCNKHMVRKHRVSLAKTVRTDRGMMPLNQETLKPKEIDMESVKWGELMSKPRKKGRKKQEKR